VKVWWPSDETLEKEDEKLLEEIILQSISSPSEQKNCTFKTSEVEISGNNGKG